MKVVTFKSITDLQKYLTAQSLTVARIAAIYYDAGSEQHVLVHATA